MSTKTGLSCYEWLSEGLDVWVYCIVFIHFIKHHSSVNSGEGLGMDKIKITKKHSVCVTIDTS